MHGLPLHNNWELVLSIPTMTIFEPLVPKSSGHLYPWVAKLHHHKVTILNTWSTKSSIIRIISPYARVMHFFKLDMVTMFCKILNVSLIKQNQYFLQENPIKKLLLKKTSYAKLSLKFLSVKPLQFSFCFLVAQNVHARLCPFNLWLVDYHHPHLLLSSLFYFSSSLFFSLYPQNFQTTF